MAIRLPAAMSLLCALVLCPLLDAAPRSGIARASEDKPSKSSTSEEALPKPQPVLTKRVITKVNGVIVDDTEEPQQAMQANSGQMNRAPIVPEGVYYGPAPLQAETSGSEGTPNTTPEEQTVEETARDENPEAKPGENFLNSMFSGFFNPSREAESNRMRSGKGRAQHLAPPGEAGPAFIYAPVPEPPDESPFIAPSRNLIIGEVVSVNKEMGITVVWMQSRFIALDRNVITRNHELETTAVLRPTSFRNGHAYGLTIAVGQPRVGDELVLADAGPAIRRRDDLSVNVCVGVEPSPPNECFTPKQ